MIDEATMSLLMYGMMILMVLMLVMGFIKDNFNKKKKKDVEIPRDTMERLTKAYKNMTKAGLNKERVRYTLWMSGDKYFPGYRAGDIVAIQPQNEEYIAYLKNRWWYFWRKPIPIKLDVELMTDFNCRDIVAEARGYEAQTEGEYYLIPSHGVPKGMLEKAHIKRAVNREIRVLKQSIMDADVDIDCIPKIALRGDIGAAFTEVGRYEEMPSLPEEELSRQQKRMLRDQNKATGGGN